MTTDCPAGPTAAGPIYTAGDLARLLGLSQRTVSKYIDAGRIRGTRLPGGSRDRRVTRAALAEFVADNPGMADLIEATGHDLEEILGPDWSPAP